MPHLNLSFSDVLDDAVFHLAKAEILWENDLQSVGWGRDGDRERAQWKAIGEAIERYCYAQPLDFVYARAAQLPDYLNPECFVRYTSAQFKNAGFPFKRFDPASWRYWALAQSVLSGKKTLAAADLVCDPSVFDPGYRARLLTSATTSGCAAAEGLNLAILRATLELIERDAFMRHWFAQRPGHCIDPSSLPPAIRTRLEALADLGCDVGLQWLGMGSHPTWLAWARHAERHFTSVGTACGLEAEQSLETALNELETQARARALNPPSEPMLACEVRTPADHAALYASLGHFGGADALWRPAGSARRFDEAAAAFETTACALYEKLGRSGSAPYWIDLSRPEASSVLGRVIHVVRVLAPNLIPMAFGFGRQPLGMDIWRVTSANALHPFS
jgi:ribosomal protein S12 methylthiotransferase accessory factor